MDYYNSELISVMTIDGLHYIESLVATSNNSYELTLLFNNLWEGEVFEVPSTVYYQGKEYTVTGIDVGRSVKLETLRELRIPPTVRHIFPWACVGITSLRKVNIPDHCHVHSHAFAHCGIEELILGEHVILEDDSFEGIRAKQVNIPETTKFSSYSRESYEFNCYYELSAVDAEHMEEFIEGIFAFSMWDLMELLNKARKGDKRAEESLASYLLSRIREDQEDTHEYTFSADEILNLMDENEKRWISQYEEKRLIDLNMSHSDEDDDLPF